ncbi:MULTISPECIES: group III truncated hemoglobin [unclassified Janthinobacterium]|uniref:Preprotein translocase subunit TatC n=1 Tax=Janthinobacterium lividum TaxID=29581 RepID=A0A1E8PMR3_9BURK|nr:group III truncated hemoglobin [Janthinobacterium sp. CG_23.4]MCL6485043.1 group III truncated hemoglobin [Janthinobacterium lividum]MDH6158823.1 hemoglobin [Janthinobacterium sp. CG_23.4]OFJ47485.1 preprotein translocase subunit TatC [Janthinobacterium lividum]
MNHTSPLPHTHLAIDRVEVCSEDDVKHLVHTFYAAVRDDAMLGPIFAAEVKDWNVHLATLVDFWSGLLRGTMRYHGKPLAQHAQMKNLTPCMFRRWLTLFFATTESMGQPALQEKADTIALNIAERLWKSFAESHTIVAPQL